MLLEIVAIAVVERGEVVDLFGGGEPAAGVVVDENAAHAARRIAALEKDLDLGHRRRPGALELELVDEDGERVVGQLEGVVDMLGERARQVRHVGFGIAQMSLAGFPFAPAAQRQDGDAGERDKARDKQRQRCGAGIAAGADHERSPIG